MTRSLSYDLTPVHELTVALPSGAVVVGDKGYISATDALSIFEATGVQLVSIRHKNIISNSWADDFDIKAYRKQIETAYSQLEKIGVNSFMRALNAVFNSRLGPVFSTLLLAI